MRVELAHTRAQHAHERAAQTHERAARFFDDRGEVELAARERGLARKDREGAELEQDRARLRREWRLARCGERAGQPSQDGQVDVELDSLKVTHPKREQRPPAHGPPNRALH